MPINSQNKRFAIVLTSAVLFVSIAVLVLSVIAANRLQQKVAERQLQLYLERVELENQIENDNLFLTLNIVKDWANTSMLRNNDIEELNTKFIPLISNTPQVSAISVVQSSGETYCIRHEEPYYESYFTLNDTLQNKQVWFVDPDKENRRVSDTLVKYAVTSLPSYKNYYLQDYDSIVNYPLQLIPGISKLAGIAFTIKTKDASGTEYVITAYKTLKRIYSFLNSIKVSESSEVHLFTPDGRYFDYNKLSLTDSTSPTIDGYLVPWEEVKGTSFYTALNDWNLTVQHDSLAFISFKHNGESFMAAFRPNRDAVNGVWTALVMSEADFAFVLKGKLGLVFIISIAFLIMSVVAIIILFTRISNVERINPLDDIELSELIKSGENDFVEFKSTVRFNLHSNKMGKEIELAWLKSVVAFCNTQGGRILIGVKDDGEVVGLEADRFPNEDKTLLHIQNLIKQHIGLEFAKYIHYSLRSVHDKKILVVRCQPISAPMFLRFNDKEQFFVRSGPASIELPVSKALQYINDRGK